MDYATLLFLNIGWVLSKVYASSLASSLRFYNKCLQKSSFPRFSEVMINFGVVVGVEKGSRVEIVVLGELILHFGEGKGKGIFPGDDAHGGKVVNSLHIGHFLKGLIEDTSITPFYLPILSLPKILYLPIETLTSTNLL